MIYPLNNSRYGQVRPLFRRLQRTQPMCTAVLEGVYPGKVFVDDAEQPKTALLTTFLSSEAEGVWGFLAGDPAKDAFNRALNAAIFNRQVIGADTPVVFLTCDPQDWGGRIGEVVAPRSPIRMPRQHYVCRQIQYDGRAALPEGMTVHRLTEDLLLRPGLDVPKDVCATMTKWRAAAGEHFRDYGFVTLDETGEKPVIACWATVDFVAGGAGDIGFFTQPAYRRRGLGTITAAAALEYGLAHGVSWVSWTCSADNPGSIHAAEKLGLERGEDYSIYLLVFDEAQHWSTAAYYALGRQAYAEAARAYDQAFVLSQEHPHYICYEAARAWAMLGDSRKALSYLSLAAARGWSDVADARERQEFENLRRLPEWNAVVAEMGKA